MKEFKDNRGNNYSISDNGIITFTPKSGIKKMIGKIIDGLYEKNEDMAHIYRKTNSWSINSTILDLSSSIRYITEKDIYTISKSKAIENCSYKIYNNELKAYVPLKYWNTGLDIKTEQLKLF
jgi:hypothetical protein